MTIIRICLLVVVKYLQKILNKLVIKLSEPISTDRVRLVDVTTKSNNMKIFMFRCDYVCSCANGIRMTFCVGS